MDALTPFVPVWGAPEEWNLAYEKVENYLRAFRVESRLHRARLIQMVLQRVADRPPPTDGTTLTTLAIREVQAMMQEWFGRIMQETRAASDTPGRLGLLLCDGQTRWPYCFLEPDRVPAAFPAATAHRIDVSPPALWTCISRPLATVTVRWKLNTLPMLA